MKILGGLEALLLILFQGVLLDGWSQNIVAPGLTVFGPSQGLVQTTVTDLEFDSNGLLWVSTFGGVHSFDGYQFRHIEQPTAKAQNAVIRSMVSNDEVLWVSNLRELHALDLYTHKWVNSITLSEHQSVDLVYAYNDSLILFDFADSQLTCLNIQTGQASLLPCPRYKGNALTTHQQGSQFILAAEKSVWLYDFAQSTQPKIVALSDTPSQVAINASGDAVAVIDTTIYRFDGETFRSTGVGTGDDRIELAHYNGSTVLYANHKWFAFGSGENQPKHFKIQDERFTGNRSAPLINHILGDHDGNVWIAADGIGIVQVSKFWQPLNLPPSIEWQHQYIRCLQQIGDRIYAGTQSGNLLIYHPERPQEAIKISEGQPLFFIHPLPNDRLLLGGEAGLFVFNPRSGFTSSRVIPSSAGHTFRAVVELDDSLIVLGHQSSFILPKNNPTRLKAIANPAFTGKAIANLGHKLAIINTSGSFMVWESLSSLESAPLFIDTTNRYIALARYDEHWLLTSEAGMHTCNQHGQVQPVVSALNTPIYTRHTYAALKDFHGRLWFTTNEGLFTADPITGNRWQFKMHQGAQSNEFNQGCAMVCHDGSLLFGGISGVNHIAKDFVAATLKLPDPIALPFEAWSAKGSDDPHPEFIRFVIPYYSDTENCTVWVRLTNQNKDNSPTNDRPLSNGSSLLLQNLKPGDYTLRVCSKHTSGASTEWLTVSAFTIAPLFYETWWFWTVLAALGMAIVLSFIIIHYRRHAENLRAAIEKERALAELRREIADDLHDDLGAGLTRLTLITDQFSLRYPELIHETRTLGKTARDLTKGLREAVMDLKRANEKPEDFAHALTDIAFDLFNTSNIRYSIECDHQTLAQLSPTQLQCLWLVTKEAFNNAIRHAHASNVKWTITRGESIIAVVIHDNGVGFDPNTAKKQGLASMRRRVERLGGQFHIQSQENQGTQLTISFFNGQE